MCHYKSGNKNEVTFVFSCPGRYEEEVGVPAAKVTGRNLDTLLSILNRKIESNASFNRQDITITNATTNVEFKSKTGRTEATAQEVLDLANIQRLYHEIKNTKKFIVCCGNNAKLGVDAVYLNHSRCRATIIYLPHLGLQGLNCTIKHDIHGNKLVKKSPGNTYKRLKVISEKFIDQI
ncbi:uracil-DNA glycosylase family protein [Turicibacter sanguinis]|uniref:uracil-DNA glycosylase family protein n=1 Tax=Turicibacter sanguinis TaxID=154288 RepID=UPI00232EBD9A|nr:hypothetical protein [Turicibacter sanguinis]MDB8459197.1 hypothetical protein [Turicibacter sanguinis]